MIKRLQKLSLDYLFPITCLGCGRLRLWLCPACFLRLPFKAGQLCLACHSPSRSGEFCPTCAPEQDYEGAFAAGDYNDPLLSDLIKKFKFQGLKDLGRPLGAFLMAAINASQAPWPEFLKQILGAAVRRQQFSDFLKTKPLIIPIPLSRSRLRRRGYNQAEILAENFSALTGLALRNDYLVRTKDRPPQSKLTAAQRQANLHGCFAVQGQRPAKQNLLLLDDVVTTGATLAEAAKTLRQDNNSRIWALVLARG